MDTGHQPKWWNIPNNSWTAYNLMTTWEKLQREKPSMLAANYHANNFDDMIPTHLNQA
jgi:hypothetical protein